MCCSKFFFENLGGFDSFDLPTIPTCVFAPIDHVLAGQKTIRLEELDGQRFVTTLREHSPRFYDGMVERCHSKGVNFEIAAVGNTLDATLMFVAAGIGITLLPLCLKVCCSEELVPIEVSGEEDFDYQGEILWKKENQNPALKYFKKAANAFDFLQQKETLFQ